MLTQGRKSNSGSGAQIADEALLICKSIHVEIDPDKDTYQATVSDRPLVEADSIRSLVHRLTYELYVEFHTGSTLSGKDNTSVSPQLMHDPRIVQRLKAVVPHSITETSGTFVEWLSDRSIVVVEFSGVRIAVPVDRLLTTPAQPGSPVLVQVPAVRPALSYGFCVVDGLRSLSELGPTPLRRVYLHIASPEGAAQAWGAVLPTLNKLAVPYRTKALSRRKEYPRRDAIVFYLPVEEARSVADFISESLSGFGLLEDATPIFARRIGPGVALADEPADPRPSMRAVSFGEHRCHALAEAAVSHALQPQTDLREVLVARLLTAGIDPRDLAFNVVPLTNSL